LSRSTCAEYVAWSCRSKLVVVVVVVVGGPNAVRQSISCSGLKVDTDEDAPPPPTVGLSRAEEATIRRIARQRERKAEREKREKRGSKEDSDVA